MIITEFRKARALYKYWENYKKPFMLKNEHQSPNYHDTNNPPLLVTLTV